MQPTANDSKCLDEERKASKLSHLSARCLDLGLKKTDSTRGHVFQACGAVQKFLEAYPQHKSSISASSPVDPYKPTGKVLADWKTFLSSHSGTGTYGQGQWGYNYDTLRGYLTRKYGGRRTGGGGGDNEFEIVLRLVSALGSGRPRLPAVRGLPSPSGTRGPDNPQALN
jgi:hypothetical protein